MINSLIAGIIIAYSTNAGGGRINITDEQGDCPASQRVAFAYNAEGEVGTGCWVYSQGLILVNWDSGNGQIVKRIYESKGFTVTPEAVEPSISPP